MVSDYYCNTGKDDGLESVANRNTMYVKAIMSGQYHDNENAEIEKNDKLIEDAINSDQGRGTKLSKEEKMSRARKMADLGVKQAVIADTLGVSVRMVKKYLNGK